MSLPTTSPPSARRFDNQGPPRPLRKYEQLWFEDDSIILQADNALHDPSCVEKLGFNELDDISSILQLSAKYEVEMLKSRVMSTLGKIFPSNLNDYMQRGTRYDEGTRLPVGKLFKLVNIAREENELSQLLYPTYLNLFTAPMPKSPLNVEPQKDVGPTIEKYSYSRHPSVLIWKDTRRTSGIDCQPSSNFPHGESLKKNRKNEVGLCMKLSIFREDLLCFGV
ncbi:hypothetical protein C8Q75DRAFT_868472 [Abortiporus biennis]|nr:hypothetical protein C8Q75DRAFT_868472 [Abortiporus biennis]